MASSKRARRADLRTHVASVLQACVKPHNRLCLGLSGGLDSVVLLDVLASLRDEFAFGLSAIHVNHWVSPYADSWEAFCVRHCREAGVPLHVERITITHRNALGLEAAARAGRYAAYSGEAVDFMVLAHHLDDQVETTLLQLLRGSGVKGLSAMPGIRSRKSEVGSQKSSIRSQKSEVRSQETVERIPGELSSGIALRPAILRPLLEIPRSVLAGYAAQKGLSWVDDESNRDTRFGRNFLRHRVLPLLEERFPAYRETFARTARHLGEAAELLEDLAGLDAAAALKADRLSAARLHELSQPRARNLLRFFITLRGAPLPNANRLEEILRQLLTTQADGGLQVTWRGYTLRRFRGEVSVEPVSPAPPLGLCVPWHGESEIRLELLGGFLRFETVEGSGINLQKLHAAPVTFRLRRGGERMRPDPARPRRTLKNLLQETHVPIWERQRMPLLFCAEHLVWVPEIGVDSDFQALTGETGLHVTWEKIAEAD